MSYTLNKQYALGANEGSSQAATGKMIVFHSTANIDTSAANNAAYEKREWNGGNRGPQYAAYVHFIAGDGVVYQVGEPGYVAWGAGPTANGIAPVQIEMEESSDNAKQLRIYNTVIELVHDMCKKYGIAYTFEANSYTGVQSHRHIAQMNGETDHTDPWAPLARIGKSQAQVAADIKSGVGTGIAASVTPTKPATKATAKINVTYALRPIGSSWLPDVVNFGTGADGYAGLPNHAHDLLCIKADHGTVKYRTHTLGAGWEAYVSKGDKRDTVSGCAGVPGKAIDGVEIIYLTPAGEEYRQAWYRSQTVARSGWLGTVCDDGKSICGYTDSYAGMIGEALDRLQIFIGTNAPY